MRKQTCLIIFFCLNTFYGHSQSNPLPSWDYRSINTIQANLGIRYYRDKQNHSFSGFLKVDYSFAKDINRKKFLNNKPNYYNRNINAAIGLDCEARRNFKIYHVKTKYHKVGIKSWTLNIDLNLNVEWLLRPISASYFKASTEDVNGVVLGAEYRLINSSNSGFFKYLGNTNGRGALKVRHLTDKWGGQIYLQNDYWIFFSKQFTKHDHGNTTEFGFSFYTKPFIQQTKRGEGVNTFYDNRMFSVDYWFQIITDRKIANNTSSGYARLGYYSVRNDKIFHGYNRIGIKYSHYWFSIQTGIMIDNLLMGRNLQRWAHQGTTHRNLKQRKRYGWFLPKKDIFRSPFYFHKNNKKSKQLFIKQYYYNNDTIYSKLIEQTLGNSFSDIKVDSLSNADIRKLFKLNNGALKMKYKSQLFVNKYRFRKSKVMVPTALFPWEGRQQFYKRLKAQYFFDVRFFKSSFRN